MGKTITITEEKYRELVAQIAAEIVADHSKDSPEATLMFSLTCMAFSARLGQKLFTEDKDNE